MDRPRPPVSRWTLVAVAAATMGVGGTYQFVWSSVRVPLGSRLVVPEAALGTVFTLFVVFQTVSQFPAGWVRDRYGPRIPMLVGAVLLAAGYSLVAFAGSLPVVYVGYGLGGIGTGVAYTVSLNTAVKWFDDRRGLATGVVGMAYGGLSFALIPVARGTLQDQFRETLLALAAFAGVVGLVGAFVLRDPARATDAEGGAPAAEGEASPDGGGETPDGSDGPPDEGGGTPPSGEDPGKEAGNGGSSGSGGSGEPGESNTPGGSSGVDPAADPDPTTWREVVRTWQFWLLYAVFLVANGVGLMVIDKVVVYAGELELTAATATAAASAVAVADAGGVVAIGAVSDRLGRERTSAATLVASGVALAGTTFVGDAGVGAAFVALVGATAFFRSPVFAVFPSLIGDYYGEARSSENYAVLYTAKLWGGVVGGTVASGLVVSLGWSTSFLLGGGLLSAAGLSLVLLRPPSDPPGGT